MLATGASDTSEVIALGQQAFQRGQEALAAGDAAEAIRWFDRACRLAPHDLTLVLSHAAAFLGVDDRQAAALLQRVVGKDDVREAWFGLAAALRNLRDFSGAAGALAHALSYHALDRQMRDGNCELAHDIARANGAAGWCGFDGAGALVVGGVGLPSLQVRLDELAVAPRSPATKPAGAGTVGTWQLRRVRLPAGWQRVREISVRSAGRDLLGSPIRIAAILRTVGYVEAHAGGLRGWAWHPGDADSDPELVIGSAAGKACLHVTATDLGMGLQHNSALARPRGFAIPARMIAGMAGPLTVRGRDGTEVLGSPLDPRAEQDAAVNAARTLAALYPATQIARRNLRPTIPPAMPVGPAPGAKPMATTRRRPPVDVVIPVYGNAAATRASLESVLSTVRRPCRVLLVDDASPDPALMQALVGFARDRRIRILRNSRNRGFPAGANAGIAMCRGRDVVLLNSDTLVPPNWLERLRAAAYSAPDIGTATPLSNNASILSYPNPCGNNATPDLALTIRLDEFARRSNPDVVVDIPVAVGFCMYLRRDCIDAVGLFRADVFAQGYGEENDFCLRARHLGWRHVAVAGLFVAHVGAASFGRAGLHLKARNERVLNRLHPGYDRLIADFIATDPLAEYRRRIDVARWREAAPRGQQSVILITHADGGGVERHLGRSAAAHLAAGRRVITLRPDRSANGTHGVIVGDAVGTNFPNLRFVLPAETPVLLRQLRNAHPGIVEVHHLLGHPPAIYKLIAGLNVPYEVHVHDYLWFCPRISLVGQERRYCGEPGAAQCEACIADAGRLTKDEIGIRALRDRSDTFLRMAARVVAPSDDAAARLRRHFPALRPMVIPLEDDAVLTAPVEVQRWSGRCSRICIAGAIGVHKGYDILLACARDAADRDLKLEFIVVGHTIDDGRLLATGRVFVTGRYEPDEVVPMIRAQGARFGFLPSVWPETWCFALSELWRAGLDVVAFDFGAPAERIRRTGRGLLLPLGLAPNAINNALIAAAAVLDQHEV